MTIDNRRDDRWSARRAPPQRNCSSTSIASSQLNDAFGRQGDLVLKSVAERLEQVTSTHQ